jgi:outer membrane biosynthesis protein TonB
VVSMDARVPRIIAGAAALIVNLLLLAALTMPTSGSGGFPAETPERVLVFLADTTSTAHEPLPKQAPHERHRSIGAPVPHAILSVPLISGPPTETLASIAQNVLPDRDATVIDIPGLRDTCQRSYPGEFTSELAEGATMVLRVFVMPDGRIGQGTVTSSSGDEYLDLMTLKCVQAYAQLNPAKDDESPIGSWQRLTWHWSQP